MSEPESTGLTKIALKPAGVEPFLVFMNAASQWSTEFKTAITSLWELPPMTQAEYEAAAKRLSKGLSESDAAKLMKAAGK